MVPAMGTALITGASAGLGESYAKLFAADKHDVILVARRRDRLDTLAAQLREKHGIQAHVIDADLARADGVERVISEVKRLGLADDVEFLVNNAGFATNGPFSASDTQRELDEIHVNITALVILTRAFLPAMVERKRGRILNIGSTAGFQPGPFMATYYATKAFVNSFTEALWFELKGTGVTATVSCPGAVHTEFAQVAGTSSSRLFRLGAMSSDDVALRGYRAMKAGVPIAVHGAKNKFTAFGTRITPRALVRVLAAQMNLDPDAPRA